MQRTIALFAILSLACSPASEELTWHQDAQPIVEVYCATCHADGSMAPFALETLDQVRTWAEPIRAAVEAETMPPWKPADRAPLKFDRSLRSSDRDILLAWLDAGMAEGDPTGPVRPVPPLESIPPVRPDRVLAPEAALELSETGDHYQCFQLGEPAPDPQHIRSIEIRPGNPAVVHHVAFYEVTPLDRQEILDRDAADPRPGYTCYGSGPGGCSRCFCSDGRPAARRCLPRRARRSESRQAPRW